MLQIPQKKFSRSVNQINIERDVLADWIEASLLFHENEVTKSDVVDILIEEQICDSDNQDLAHQIASLGWTEIHQRVKWGNLAPDLQINGPRITDVQDWRADPIRAFFLMLSIMRYYPDWSREHQNYPLQGDLFERVVELICPALLPGWQVYRVGWSPDNPVTIAIIVRDLCELLNTIGHRDLASWVPDAAKDGGLDIVCFRQFPDDREATPTFFVQCASGTNWRNKIQTPNPVEWQKFLDAAVQPSTGIATPFVISTEEIRYAGLSGQIVVFDRLRLLHATYVDGLVVPEDLRDELLAWIDARVKTAPLNN